MRQRITKSAIDRLSVGGIIADANPVGFVARRLRSGAVTYGFRFRDKRSGRQRWIGIGIHGDLTAEQARKKALRVAAEVRDGGTPTSAAVAAAKRRRDIGVTVNTLLDEFLVRHVRPNLRGAAGVESAFNRYVRPRIGTRSVHELTRLEVVQLLDAVEDNSGPVAADRLLASLRKGFRWWAARDDKFVPPIVPGMARTKPKQRARSRILNDEEIRDLWHATNAMDMPPPYAAFMRALLLTCQRRDEVARMAWEEIDGDLWEIPGARYKTGLPNAVPLTATMLRLIGEPKKAGFVFSVSGGSRPINAFHKCKLAIDAAITELRQREGREPMPRWVLHDLRRTGRSLMSRAGVLSDHAERVLGHVIGGVRAVYDVFEYLPQKQAALEKLAALIERILEPDSRVVRLPVTR
jgi:integrase